MVYRIYTVNVLDGFGDIGHLIDRATANMSLPQEFRSQNPEIYCFHAGEEKASVIRKKLEKLPEDHPLHYSKIGSTVFINPEKSKLQRITDAVVYEVSTSSFIDLDRDPKNRWLKIGNGEFGFSNFLDMERSRSARKDSPFHRHLGFGDCGHGIFIKPKRERPDNQEILQRLNGCENQTILKQVFDFDEAGGATKVIGQSDLEAFQQNSFFVPAYVQDQNFFDEIIKDLAESPVTEGKRVVMFVTGDKKYYAPSDLPENIKIIDLSGKYVDDQTYQALQLLCNDKVHVCSGDKSFEEALSQERVPIFQVKRTTKSAFYDSMLKVVAGLGGDEEEKERVIKYLRHYRNITNKAVPQLTTAMCDYWKDVVIPDIRRNHDYNKAVPKIEEQSLLLHQIMFNDLGREDLAEKLRQFSNDEIYGMFLHIKHVIKPREVASGIDSKKLEQIINALPRDRFVEICKSSYKKTENRPEIEDNKLRNLIDLLLNLRQEYVPELRDLAEQISQNPNLSTNMQDLCSWYKVFKDDADPSSSTETQEDLCSWYEVFKDDAKTKEWLAEHDYDIRPVMNVINNCNKLNLENVPRQIIGCMSEKQFSQVVEYLTPPPPVPDRGVVAFVHPWIVADNEKLLEKLSSYRRAIPSADPSLPADSFSAPVVIKSPHGCCNIS